MIEPFLKLSEVMSASTAGFLVTGPSMDGRWLSYGSELKNVSSFVPVPYIHMWPKLSLPFATLLSCKIIYLLGYTSVWRPFFLIV